MEDFIPTRATQTKRNAAESLEVTTYVAPKKKLNPNKVHFKKEKKVLHEELDELGSDEEMDTPNEPPDERRQQELEMKRFRYDVIKFGMSGFAKKKAKQAKVALAISLGAKPPKNKRRNYKMLVAERKVEKAQQARKDKFASGFNPNQLNMKKKDKKPNGKSDGRAKPQSKKNKKSDGILGVYGKVTKDKRHKRKRDK